jgi:predicted flavoprotein YhiN
MRLLCPDKNKKISKKLLINSSKSPINITNGLIFDNLAEHTKQSRAFLTKESLRCPAQSRMIKVQLLKQAV